MSDHKWRYSHWTGKSFCERCRIVAQSQDGNHGDCNVGNATEDLPINIRYPENFSGFNAGVQWVLEILRSEECSAITHNRIADWIEAKANGEK